MDAAVQRRCALPTSTWNSNSGYDRYEPTATLRRETFFEPACLATFRQRRLNKRYLSAQHLRASRHKSVRSRIS